MWFHDRFTDTILIPIYFQWLKKILMGHVSKSIESIFGLNVKVTVLKNYLHVDQRFLEICSWEGNRFFLIEIFATLLLSSLN